MRVACLLSEFPQPSETFILNQIAGLTDRGCKVDIYADRPAGPPLMRTGALAHELQARTIYRPRVPKNYLARLLKATALLIANLKQGPRTLLSSFNAIRYGREAAALRLFYASLAGLGSRPYDIVHAHFGPNGLVGAMLRDTGALCGKLVTTFYGYDLTLYLRQARGRSYRFLFRTGDLFIALSETMRRQLIELGCPDERIVVHRLGVDRAKFHRSGLHDATGERIHIVTVARLVAKKGIAYALDAVARLAQAGNAVRYTIVGDGPLRSWIAARVEQLGLGEAVSLLGWRTQDDVVDLLSRADILLAPSITDDEGDQEGTPVAVLEAMAAGLPVVATCHAAIPEMITDSVSGLLVPERDVEALAAALVTLIQQPETRARMGLAGRSEAARRHDLATQNDGLVSIYRGLLEGRLPRTADPAEAVHG